MHAAASLRRLATSRALYLLLGIFVIGLVLAQWVEALGGPSVVWERFGVLAPLVTVPIHMVVAITPLPSDVIGIANGTVYGFWGGFVLNWLGWYLASFIQYAIGRRVQQDFDVERWLERAPERLQRFPVGHPVFIIGARYMPYAGGHLATLVPGAFGVGLGRFAWCTALAVVPTSLIWAGIGAGLMLLG